MSVDQEDMYRNDELAAVEDSPLLIRKEENSGIEDVSPNSDGSSYYAIILPTFLFFAVMFGIVPMSYQVIIEQICKDMDAQSCTSTTVSSKASMVILYCNSATYLPGLLTTGLYSSVANIHGRKLVMIVSLVGVVIYSLLYCYVALYNPDNYVLFVVIASFIMGATGSYTTFIMGVFSYVADSTMGIPEQRNRAYSVTESCLYLGKIVGPLASGVYAHYFGFIVPLFCAAVLASFAVILVLTIPESLPLYAPTRKSKLVLNPFQTMHNISLLFTHRPKYGSSPLPWASIAFFLYYLALMGWVAVVYVYMKHVLHWGALMFGVFDSIMGIIQAISMLFIPSIVHTVVGRELKLITWVHMGYLVRGLFWLILPLLRSTASVLCVAPILLLTGPITPYTRTVLSNTVSAEQQSQIFAAFSAIESISTLLSPVFSAGYSFSVKYRMPWLMFEVMAGFALCAFMMISYVRVNPELRCNLPDQSKDTLLAKAEMNKGKNDSITLGSSIPSRRHTRASVDSLFQIGVGY